jgi:hypothetical protein
MYGRSTAAPHFSKMSNFEDVLGSALSRELPLLYSPDLARKPKVKLDNGIFSHSPNPSFN